MKVMLPQYVKDTINNLLSTGTVEGQVFAGNVSEFYIKSALSEELGWKSYSNNRADEYAIDIVDFNRNYLIDVKVCHDHQLPNSKVFGTNDVIKIKHDCLIKYQKECEKRNPVLLWEWLVCIYCIDRDEVYFLNQNTLDYIKENGKYELRTNLSINKIDEIEFIYINPLYCLDKEDLERMREKKLNEMHDEGFIYNDNYKFDKTEIFKKLISPFDSVKESYNGLFLLEKRNALLYYQFSRNSCDNSRYHETLTKDDCLVLYDDKIKHIENTIKYAEAGTEEAYIGIYVCYEHCEHEFRILDLKEFKKYLNTGAVIDSTDERGKKFYNISKKLFLKDVDFFK